MKHSAEFLAIVDDAKRRIREISVSDALEHLANGAQLIDVREDNEWDEHAENGGAYGPGNTRTRHRREIS